MDLGLRKKIPASLRNDFWLALMDSVEEEILRMREEIDKKKSVFTPSLADMERLKELGDLVYELDYGFLTVIENLLINSYNLNEEQVTEFLRTEILKIPFQVKNKALLQLYLSFFNFISFSLDNRISVYQTTTKKDIFTGNTIIIRDLVSNLLTGLEESFETYNFIDDNGTELEDASYLIGFDRPYSTFFVQNVTGNFIGKIRTVPTLDSDEEYLLDDGLIMDTSPVELKTPTKHLSLEVVANQLFERIDSDGIARKYLFTSDSAAYLYSGFYYNKKASEVPHIGLQLTFFVDKTGFSNFFSSSLASLGSRAVINPSVLAEGIVSTSQISYIQFGVGTRDLPEYSDVSPVYPTRLVAPIYSKVPYIEERYSSDLYMGAIAEYIGQAVGSYPYPDIPLGAGTTSFSGIQLPTGVAPIKPNTLKMAFIDITSSDPFSSMMRITDDGFGNLVSDYCSGKINYTTGIFNFDTTFEKEHRESFTGSGVEIEKTFLDEVIPGSFNFVLRIPVEGDGHKYYYITDDGEGNLISDYDKFVSGTIVYTVTPTINLTFSESLEFEESIISYKYVYSTSLTPAHKLYLYEVYTENPIQLREAGLFVRTLTNPTVDQMLAYITFPAIEFTYNYYHVNLGIIFER